MKKVTIVLMLGLVSAAGMQAFAGAQETTSDQSAQLTIQDSAEHNAYIAAYNQSDPAARAAAMEVFLQQYPSTVVKEDALAVLMAAYEQSKNMAQASDAATRALQINPNNVRALLLLVYLKRSSAQGPKALESLMEAGRLADQGIRALQTMKKSEGMSDGDFQKLKTVGSTIFHGASGFAAFQAKDYVKAQQELRTAVEASPSNDPSTLQDVYPLALAYLESTPPDYVNGLWFIARAINLSNNNAAYTKYGRSQYVKFHGSDEGWQQLLAQAKNTPLPPLGFSINAAPPRPSASEQSATMVREHDVTQMAFSDWKYILSSGNQDAADKVWNAIKGKTVGLQGKVITATRNKITVAAEPDSMEQRVADVELTLAAPARMLPAVGSTIKFQGDPVSYDANPFRMRMSGGSIAKSASRPAPRPAARKRPARRRR